MGLRVAFSPRVWCEAVRRCGAVHRSAAPLIRWAWCRHYYRRPLPTSCISFYSTEGKQLFKEALEAGHMDCYFQLAAQFRTQDEPAFCGLTTLVMVLNALAVDPHQVWKGVWRWYHEDMLECCVSKSRVLTSGITLSQFACLAECNGLKTAVASYTSDGLHKFRKIVKSITSQDAEFLVVSYSRLAVEQTGDGHFSPVAGYHPGRDLALVLDTARFKYPPHWIDLQTLFRAMEPPDPSTGRPRGYCVMKKSHNLKASLFSLSPSLLSRPATGDSSLCGSSVMATIVRTWLTHLVILQASAASPDPQLIASAFIEIFAPVFNLSDLVRVDAAGRARPAVGALPSSDCAGTSSKAGSNACLYDSIGHWNFLVRGIEQTEVFRICDRLLEDASASPSFSKVAKFVELTREEIKRTMLWCKDRSECASSAEHYAKASRLAAVLRPAHALAMLLLSWPYEATATGHLSSLSPLQALVNASIAAHDNMVLAAEVSQLRAAIVDWLSSEGLAEALSAATGRTLPTDECAANAV